MYTPQTFDIGNLTGISETTINEHLKLYEGYVKNTNLILDTIANGDVDGYALSEMQRRFGFEFNGMKNHELYFASLAGGASESDPAGKLTLAIEEEWGSFDGWLERFKTIAKTRGVGWAMLVYDSKNDRLLNTWIDEQHLGHLLGCTPILALDMWEHSFVADYQPSGKGQYIDDFFGNLSWSFVEQHFASIVE